MEIWADSEAWQCTFGQKKTLFSEKSYRNNFQNFFPTAAFSVHIEFSFENNHRHIKTFT